MVMRVHATFESFGVGRPVKEPGCNSQSVNLITRNPCVTDLVNLALQFSRSTRAMIALRFSGACLERRWQFLLRPLTSARRVQPVRLTYFNVSWY